LEKKDVVVNDAEEILQVVDFEKEDVVENDVEEVVREDDYEMEGYFEKNVVVEDFEIEGYFEKLEYPHSLYSTVKQSISNEFLQLYLYTAIG
jgi:hypothetical protein